MVLMMLVGTSSAWATRVYYVNTNGWSTINCYAWEKSSNTNEKEWPGTDITANKCSFQVAGYDVYYYETQKTKSDYCIFNNGSESQTADLEIANCTNVKDYLSNYAWMFYITQSYGGTLCLKANNNSVGKSFHISSGKAYVVVTKSEVLDKTLKVSNNCGGWDGAGDKKGGVEVGTEEVHPGCSYEAAGSSSITKASTLSSLSIASSISKSDASAVSVTAKSSSAKSSFGNELKAQYFVDNTFVAESANLSTSGTTTTLDLSSFADGEHTLSVILTDGTISYPDAKTATFTIISCTKSVSGGSGLYSNGNITLSAEFNTCGTAYIGFQWKEKNDSWCYENNADCYVMLGEQEKSNETVTTTLTKSGGTYVFRPYIVDGSDATKWIYGDEFEVVTCTPVSAANFTVTNNNYTFDGTAKTATVKWKGEDSSDGITITYDPASPMNAGSYAIKVTTTAHGDLCASNGAITLDEELTINEAEQTDFSVTNDDYSICGKSVTVTAAGGQDGDITYSITEDNTSSEDASINPTTGVLTVKSAGTVSVQAKRAATTNYKEITDNVTFTFTMPIENVNLSIIKGLSASGDYCVGTEIQLQLTYTGATPANDGNHFEWVTDGFSSEIGNNVGGIATGATWTTTLGENDKTLQVKLQDCNGNWVESNELTFNVFERPEAPKFTPSGLTVCQGEAFTLPGSEPEGYIWSDALGKPTTANKPNGIDATTDYYAVISFGCPSPATKYTVTVNPLPTITISGSEKAVLYEDVTLTATATQGATVKWYESSEEKAEGLTYVVTSATDASKIVTAKAFLNGCESEGKSHTVAFSAENCNDVTKEEEQTVGKIKLLLSKPSWIGDSENFYCYAWENNTENKLLGNWPGTELTQKEGSYYVIIVDSNNKNIKIILNDGSEQTVDSDVLNANKIYQISATSSKNSDNKYTFNSKTDKGTYKESVTTTVPAPITAPAVKITGLSTTPGEGDINFSGQIVKTGCDNSLTYGYEYKKVGDANWTQVVLGTDLDKDPGFTFSDNTVKELDGTYEVRAFITNDNSTQYSDVRTIELSTSTVPVGLAKIELTALDGTPVEKFCIGSTAYIKVTYDVKYTTATWKSDLGVEIVPTRTTDIYQFIVKGNDEIVVLLSNRYNVEPVSSEPISVEVYASASVPEIALGASSICDTNLDGTTLTVTRTKAGQYYALYKEDGNGGTLVEDYQLCLTDNAQIEFTGLKEAAKYFVKTYTSECPSAISVTSSTTLTVVDSKDVKISIEPITTETTPWMPAKLTVTATSDYTVTSSPDDAVINISGNTVKVKLPLPEGANNVGTTDNNVNVTFDPVPYTITAALKTIGDEENPCAKPAEADILLVPYTEVCP